jgi:hypothetical protein
MTTRNGTRLDRRKFMAGASAVAVGVSTLDLDERARAETPLAPTAQPIGRHLAATAFFDGVSRAGYFTAASPNAPTDGFC